MLQGAWDNNGRKDFHTPVGGAADEAELQSALEAMLQVSATNLVAPLPWDLLSPDPDLAPQRTLPAIMQCILRRPGYAELACNACTAERACIRYVEKHVCRSPSRLVRGAIGTCC